MWKSPPSPKTLKSKAVCVKGRENKGAPLTSLPPPLTWRAGPELNPGVAEGRPTSTEGDWGLGYPAPLPTSSSSLNPLGQPSLHTCPRDLEIQESQFLDKEDWGAQQTSKEIRHLQNVCVR